MLRGSAGIYYARQNMLSQVGSVTTNGIQQKSDFRDSTFTAFADMPVWPNLLAPSASPPGTFPAFSGVRVFDRDYSNPRIFAFNAGYERELAPSLAGYVDFTVAKSDHLTRFLNYNVHGTAAAAVQPPTRDTTTYTGANPFDPQLGDVFVTNSRGHGLYRGLTLGVRKRFSQQLPARGELRPRRRTRTTTRTSAIRSPIARSTSTISTWTTARRIATSGTSSTSSPTSSCRGSSWSTSACRGGRRSRSPRRRGC